MTAEQAREADTAATRELLAGRAPPMAEKLLVEPPQGIAADPDTPALTGATTGKP